MTMNRPKMVTLVLTAITSLTACVGALGVQKTSSQPPVLSRLNLPPDAFAEVKSLKEALEVVKRQLAEDGKSEYAALLTPDRVRKAVRAAIVACEAGLDQAERENPGIREYYSVKAKPLFLSVIENKAWPRDCGFFGSYNLATKVDGRLVVNEGFWLRLQVGPEEPGMAKGRFTGLALPVLNLAWGQD